MSGHDRLRGADDAVYRAYIEVEHARMRLRDALMGSDVDASALVRGDPPAALIEALADRSAVLRDWAEENDDHLRRLDVIDRAMSLQGLRARVFDAEGAP
ncbi:MAG TPA: hypothetical protein VIT62_09990 [Lysobacter sp.]